MASASYRLDVTSQGANSTVWRSNMKTCYSCAHCSPGRRCTNPWSEDFNLAQFPTDVCPAWEEETDVAGIVIEAVETPAEQNN